MIGVASLSPEYAKQPVCGLISGKSKFLGMKQAQ